MYHTKCLPVRREKNLPNVQKEGGDGGGGSKAFRTMLKKTAVLVKKYIPYPNIATIVEHMLTF